MSDATDILRFLILTDKEYQKSPGVINLWHVFKYNILDIFFHDWVIMASHMYHKVDYN